MQTTSVDYLIPKLRIHLGDLDSNNYRYLDEWLEAALVAAIESLMVWWGQKYLLTDDDLVYRNKDKTLFQYPEPPVIQRQDVRPIILMAGIIIKGGSLENSAWNLVSWRDTEISFSNLEGGKTRRDLFKQDWEELEEILGTPRKRLAVARKNSLPGFNNNYIETSPEDYYLKK